MTRDAPHALVVDDEANVRKVLGAVLEQAGWTTSRAADGAEAVALVRAHDPDVVVTDLAMPGLDGLGLLQRLREEGFGEVPVVVLTAHGSVEVAVEAMRRGAFDFLEKPFDKQAVLDTCERARAQGERRRADVAPTPGAHEGTGIVGTSAAIRRVIDLVEKVAPAPTSVLVTGETGTGKELVARALHALSPRAGGPFVAVNCGALPESLLESELFGHVRGAFTGADRDRAGRLELADSGTLFLDEIGELTPAAQVKLLRALQERVVEPVGGAESRPVNVRVVAATHRDLERAVSEGSFRADLLYRLKVVTIDLPPLRERVEDIAPLLDRFVAEQARRLDRPRPEVADSTAEALAAHPWPGNVRELQNAVERAVLLGGPILRAEDFGLDAEHEGSSDPSGGSDSSIDLKEASREAAERTERRLIRAALAATDGNVTHAARRLGLSRRGLQLKMKELALRAE